MTSNKEWTIEERELTEVLVIREFTVSAETEEAADNMYEAGKATLVNEKEVNRKVITLPSIYEREEKENGK